MKIFMNKKKKTEQQQIPIHKCIHFKQLFRFCQMEYLIDHIGWRMKIIIMIEVKISHPNTKNKHTKFLSSHILGSKHETNSFCDVQLNNKKKIQ